MAIGPLLRIFFTAAMCKTSPINACVIILSLMRMRADHILKSLSPQTMMSLCCEALLFTSILKNPTYPIIPWNFTCQGL